MTFWGHVGVPLLMDTCTSVWKEKQQRLKHCKCESNPMTNANDNLIASVELVAKTRIHGFVLNLTPQPLTHAHIFWHYCCSGLPHEPFDLPER